MSQIACSTLALVGALLACTAAAAALVGGGPTRQRTSVAIAGAATALPWFVPADLVTVRALMALSAMWVLSMIFDLVRRPQSMSMARRLWCITAPFDARTSRATEATFDGRGVLIALFVAAIGAALVRISLFESAALAGPAYWLVRWLSGLAGFYCLVESLSSLLLRGYRWLGIAIPPIQRHPISSLSVREFWGARWNRPVSAWLRRHCFAPLCRGGRPGLGTASAFAVSGLFHAYFVLVALGWTMAGLMLSFFAVQIPLVALERVLRTSRWQRCYRWLWTATTLAASSPLFIEPMLRLARPPG